MPPSLCTVLSGAGHEALHTRHLPAQNRTTDRVVNELSLREQRVVVTKDVDFYHSHLLRREPWKLLLVRTGHIRTRDLVQLVRQHLTAIEAALEGNSLVELDHQEVRVVG